MTLEFDAALRLGEFEYEAAFDVRDEIVVLFGHSGAGKSVTLQVTAGLLRPDRGRVVIDGRAVFDSTARVDVPPHLRGAGYVVQHLALFPHMSVLGNVAFSLPGARSERDRHAREALVALGLGGFEARMPRTLSGGQQQRVALARALARDTRLLLLDEPFSALDDALRRGLRRELLRLRAERGLSVLFVTHDLREAHLLADRLAIFDGGRILQFGAREDVFRRPASRRVAELTGVTNILRGEVVVLAPGFVDVDVRGMRMRVVSSSDGWRPGTPVDVAIRAERVVLRRAEAGEVASPNVLEMVVEEDHPYGSSHTLVLRPVGVGPRLEVDLPARPYEVLRVPERPLWTVELPPEDLHVMPAG